MYNNQEEISLDQLLMMLPKELLVEKLNLHILDNPLVDGIRAYRALEQCMQRAMNDGADMNDVVVFAEPLINQINLLFDLHEELDNAMQKPSFKAELLEKQLVKAREQHKADLEAGAGK